VHGAVSGGGTKPNFLAGVEALVESTLGSAARRCEAVRALWDEHDWQWEEAELRISAAYGLANNLLQRLARIVQCKSATACPARTNGIRRAPVELWLPVVRRVDDEALDVDRGDLPAHTARDDVGGSSLSG